ncbi:MAG: ABC transporter ATP-binding protein [Hyphomicrobiales bacterium]|nr:MAG: ABC transporter ATP-binding protein [Hyphomicrobiales bacterium]
MPGGNLEVEDLVAGYGATRVLEGVSMRVAAGERLAVLGRNGVGKTTLLASIMGLTQRHGGAVRIDGQDVSRSSTSDRARKGLGYVPQTRDVFRSLNVEENLVAGLKGKPRDLTRVAYEMFPRLAERHWNLAGQLSGGEQQMLSIARAILGEPTVLLLDEPLEGLAPVICDNLMAALGELSAQRAVTMILVEQQIQRALDFAENAVVLDRGRLVWQGRSADLAASPELVERYLGAASA